ncbi:hypothetical protein NITMOv2_0743 [Nitrospira moscoviensis]|uniref:Uncharacterized protein n=1 Tax=Nitrospira moscoviensis TaxID=42253 RepID=A0A0K2G8J2_NITMO|nr:hypothetical protein NITMOv2_0743 [Nitrospira moscoviensis]
MCRRINRARALHGTPKGGEVVSAGGVAMAQNLSGGLEACQSRGGGCAVCREFGIT